ncbi:chemotaxis response regulator protein-glutamate methylesterase [Altererythrobacter sp. B11]|uniref:chemotaxis-specific protein-glutamate methyltransferase CheB n=1 Tax=Altererythrobacter sp. B11 TaxID=2060312 RepID=UPI000DC710B9|nr:chemotaxis-specific protein-glutamate methyltransferase CheB [Altererythrobacter sp. B11]BBC71791.1 chemotaxis response regulator protein-glutamate methylesterase [Altererythrobacter sp. B11]
MTDMSSALGFHPGDQRGPRALRVLVVDDSPVVRSVLRSIIVAEPDLVLAATAGSAEEALDLLDTTSVDVILLDLEMPGRGGLGAIPQIVAKGAPARVFVLSSLTVRGAEQTLAALSLGAADTLAKPRPGEYGPSYREMLARRIRALGRVARRRRNEAALAERPPLRSCCAHRPELLAMGASTGGIHALVQLLGALPARVSVPILVTQHLPSSFSEAFARQLHAASGRETLVAADRMPVRPGRILVAPGHAHLALATGADGGLLVRLDNTPAANGCCPSVDVMFASCARQFGARTMGVVLSGMGRDGAEGADALVASGGTVLAQDAASSAVWGMPGAIAAAGLASALLSPEQIAYRIASCTAQA